MLQNIFLIAGLCLLFGGLLSWHNTSKFLAKSMITKGVVISHSYQMDNEENDVTSSSFPIIQFKHPVTGIEYIFRSNVSGLMQEGQEIEIFFDPENPKKSKINKLSHTWMIPISVTLMGVFFSFFGLLARNSNIATFSILDKSIFLFLTIFLILSLNKFFRIKQEARTEP